MAFGLHEGFADQSYAAFLDLGLVSEANQRGRRFYLRIEGRRCKQGM